MINDKEGLVEFLEADRLALGKKYKKPKLIGDEIWRLQILLRKCEYYENCKKGMLNKIIKYSYFYRYHRMRLKLGLSIPLNVFNKGLSIAHFGCIVVNGNAKVGKNCRIHEGVTIGATGGSSKAANIGDNVFIGSGAKIIGDISIVSNVSIGANATVVKDITEVGTYAGSPAKKVSQNDSKQLMLIDLDIND